MKLLPWVRPSVILISLLLFFNLYFHFHPLQKSHFWVVQTLLCFIYFFSLMGEYRKYSEADNQIIRKFMYIPHSLWFRHAIICSFFIVYGLLLLLSGGYMKYLVPLVWTIGLGEIILFLFKKWSSRFYIALYANYIDFHAGHKSPLFSREIENMQIVRGTVYFFLKNKKIREIRLFVLKQEDREDFMNELRNWAEKNKISLS